METTRRPGSGRPCPGIGLTVLVTTLIVMVVGCGGGGGDDDDNVLNELALTAAPYQILDLASGSVESVAEVPDLADNPAYRTTHLVLRQIPQGSVTIGSPSGSFARQADETQQTLAMKKFYIGVFEVTQGQWRMLSEETPWTGMRWSETTTPVVAEGDSHPAYGMDQALVTDTIQRWNRTHRGTLRLPTEAQWEYACRGGTATVYSWGDSRAASVARSYAVVGETRDGVDGPRAVGGRQPNPWGLYDVHGNLWELTEGHILRGGSWLDPISLARSANRKVLEEDAAYALTGLRLMWTP